MADEGGFTTAGHAQASPGGAPMTAPVSPPSASKSLPQQQQHHAISSSPTSIDPEADADKSDPSLPALHRNQRQSHNPAKLLALRSDDRQAAPLAPSHRVRPSPVSPDQEALDGSPSDPIRPDDHESRFKTTHRSRHPPPSGSAPLSADSPPRLNLGPRASTYQVASPTSPTGVDPAAARPNRPTSYPDSAADDVAASHLPSTATVARTQIRRSPALRTSQGVATPADPDTHLPAAETSAQSFPEKDIAAKELAPGQRELLLPKAVSQSSPPDEKRMSTSHRPPPVSYKPPVNASPAQSNSAPVRVPPIRGFRSSGSRKSLALDMNSSLRTYDLGEDVDDASHDHTLRALEGRNGQGTLPMTPPASARYQGDDTGDVFMKIAREEPARSMVSRTSSEEPQGSWTRTIRPSHRRPLSTAVAAYHPTSPPRLGRRLSDQQESARSRGYDDDRSSEVSRATTYRSHARERPAQTYVGEDSTRTRAGGPVLRPSPLTSRSTTLQDSSSENPVYGRRRPSLNDNSSPATSRTPTYRSSGPGHGHNRSYNSSPLVRSYDAHGHHGPDPHNGVEGTESTASTTAPSTVWDELDDLKSRLHRLELTGKMPSTSGAAVSRLSDERPPTATTTVTTVSSSPKRTGDAAAPGAETSSMTSTQREAHSILHSALAKSKPFLSAEVFRALESAASDASSLSSMMSLPGQPGPISSGASTIGSGTTITDRQLRRKADGVCRSLTELCVALGEEATQTKAAPPAHTRATPQSEVPSTPTLNKSFNGFGGQRRASVAAENSLPPSNLTSPRTVSKFEERRNTLLNGSSLPSPRGTSASNPPTPNDTTASRRSSLLVSRTRRGDTEEPEDGRRSSLLRTRRAATEEPDEGRRTSVLVRGRRGTVGDEEDEPSFRAPSRATTEVQSARGPAREYHPQAQAPPPASETTPQPASALPRRRFGSSNLNSSRLATPASYTGGPARKYLERATPERDNGAALDQTNGDKAQRHLPLGPSMTIHRSGSLSTRRQNRDSTMTTASAAATAGAYR